MPYTEEEGGKLNNFAAEPKVYQASAPTKTQKRNYIALGIAALLLIGGLLFVAVSVSNVN